jgi:hypothetical protein
VTLNNPIWLPIGDMNAVHGLIACSTFPDKGSLNVGMVALRVFGVEMVL